MGYYSTFIGSEGDYRFELKENNQTLLSSAGYMSASDRDEAIANAQTNSQIDARYVNRESNNGQAFFDLTTSTGKVIGQSEMYSSIGARNLGKELVKGNGNTTIIKAAD